MKLEYLLNKKSQTAIDLIFGILILMIVFVVVNSFYFQKMVIIEREIEIERNTFYSKIFCDNLVYSEGYPKNWEEDISNIKILGLLNSNKEIDENKLNTFLRDYGEIMSNLNQLSYDIRLRVENLNNGEVYFDNLIKTIKQDASITSSCFSIYEGDLIVFTIESF